MILHTNKFCNGNHFTIITIVSTMYLLLSTLLRIIHRGRSSIMLQEGGQAIFIYHIYEKSRYVILVIIHKNRETKLEHYKSN